MNEQPTGVARGLPVMIVVPLLMIGGGFTCDGGKQPAERPEARDVVARVNGAVLSREELDDALPEFPGGGYSQGDKSDYVEQWIEEELLYQQAIREGLQNDEEIRKKISQFERMLLEQEVLRRHLDGKIEVTDEEVGEYYEKNRDSFIREEDEYQIDKLVFQNEEVAKEVVGELRVSPERYDELISSDAYAGLITVVDLGFFSQSEMLEALGDQAEDFGVGDVTPQIVSSSGSCYALRAVEFRPKGTVRDLSEVEDQIRNILVQAKSEEARRSWLEELKREADITVAPGYTG